MKIEFDSEKQKDKFFETVIDLDLCPSDFDIEHADNCSVCCEYCWENAILFSVGNRDRNL